MKKCYFLLLFVLLIGFTACSENYNLNINTFTERFNKISEHEIERTDFVSTKENNKIFYYYVFDNNSVLCLERDENCDLINSVSLSCKSFNNDFRELAIEIITAIDNNYINEAEKLLENNKKEYANESHTRKNLSLYFTKTTAGCHFTVSYNEIEPYQTTVCPETAENYH